MNGTYQTKHQKMRAHRNEVWDLFGNFFTEHRNFLILREQNIIVDTLSTSASTFNIMAHPNRKY